MRKLLSHTLKTFLSLLLAHVPVGASAFCPGGEINHNGQKAEVYGYENVTSILENPTMIEPVKIHKEYKGVYSDYSDYDFDNKTVVSGGKDVQVNEDRPLMEVSPEDTQESYPYEDVKEEIPSVTPKVVVSNTLNEKFSYKSLILPGGLIAAGVIGLETGLFKGREDNDNQVSENSGTDVEDIVQYVPAAAYLTLGFIPGIEHKHSFVERSVTAVTAYGMMFLITKPVKHWIHERRPDLTSDDSFPSGHAATAFTGAELMRLEYGTGIGLGAYAVATGVSVLRICHNRHWFNDVIAGAGIGILCARASYWLLPLERKLFGIKNPNVAVAAFPICNPQSRQLALGCCIHF